MQVKQTVIKGLIGRGRGWPLLTGFQRNTWLHPSTIDQLVNEVTEVATILTFPHIFMWDL